jgi:hypothetical protein
MAEIEEEELQEQQEAVAPTILYVYSEGGTHSISDLISALRPEIWGRRDSDSGATIKVESG